MKPFRFLFITVVAVTLAVAAAVKMPKNFSLVCPDKGQAEIYCSSSALPSQNAGNGVIVFCPARQLDQALTRCNGVQGISVTFAGTAEDFAALLKYYRVEASEVVNIGHLIVVSGVSGAIRGGIFVAGKRVNVQVAFDGQSVTVGSPVIFGDY